MSVTALDFVTMTTRVEHEMDGNVIMSCWLASTVMMPVHVHEVPK